MARLIVRISASSSGERRVAEYFSFSGADAVLGRHRAADLAHQAVDQRLDLPWAAGPAPGTWMFTWMLPSPIWP